MPGIVSQSSDCFGWSSRFEPPSQLVNVFIGNLFESALLVCFCVVFPLQRRALFFNQLLVTQWPTIRFLFKSHSIETSGDPLTVACLTKKALRDKLSDWLKFEHRSCSRVSCCESHDGLGRNSRRFWSVCKGSFFSWNSKQGFMQWRLRLLERWAVNVVWLWRSKSESFDPDGSKANCYVA